MSTQRKRFLHSRIAPCGFLMTLLAFAPSTVALGEGPVIRSLGRNGELICTDLEPGSVVSIEWAPTVTGPWTNTWAGLDVMGVGPSGTIRVEVPMFYRVRLVSSPQHLMAVIPAGRFTMGDAFHEGDPDELPLHTVSVSAFSMDRTEVTKALWDEVHAWAVAHGYTFESEAQSKGAHHPVYGVTWYDAVKWCNARSEREGRTPAYYTDADKATVYRTGQEALEVEAVAWDAGYRLPTEAEWEHAARGGKSGQRFPWGDTISWEEANYYANPAAFPYDRNPQEGFHPLFAALETSPAGSFPPNAFGLYDMAGNLAEWCWDFFGASSYASSPEADPRGPASGARRAMRDGNFMNGAFDCRVANRHSENPGLRLVVGFRCVLPARP